LHVQLTTVSITKNFPKSANYLLNIAVIGLLIVFFASCSSRSKTAKTGTPDEKFQLAKSYYDKESYHKALPIFQELLGVYRESTKSEQVYYYIAYSLYGMGEFEAAGRHFYTFTETFINSSKIEECFYMYCLCQFYSTDPSYLDQGLSIRAIENFQLFLNLFPGTIYQEDVNKHIDVLRRKLKEKAYNNAMLYYKMQDYKAAIVTLTLCIETYPDIEEKEKISYYILRSAYKYASLSIESKQKERYKDALKHYKEYVSEYGTNGEHFRDADILREKIEDNLRTLEINQI
jgi:outer membrane protein assembly factor BamD